MLWSVLNQMECYWKTTNSPGRTVEKDLPGRCGGDLQRVNPQILTNRSSNLTVVLSSVLSKGLDELEGRSHLVGYARGRLTSMLVDLLKRFSIDESWTVFGRIRTALALTKGDFIECGSRNWSTGEFLSIEIDLNRWVQWRLDVRRSFLSTLKLDCEAKKETSRLIQPLNELLLTRSMVSFRPSTSLLRTVIWFSVTLDR